MKPQTLSNLLYLEDPKQEREWKDYLRYLLEYYPAKAWEMFQSKKLEKYLDQKTAQIVTRRMDLVKRLPADQAREQAYEEFMPANTDLPDQTSVLDDQEQEIWAWVRRIRSSPNQAVE